MTRPIGRRRSEASPVTKAVIGWRRQDAEQQPRRGAGIAEIEDVLRLGEAADADAVARSQMPSLPRSTAAPKRAQRRGGREHVLAFEQPRDLGAADGERAQHQRAVRDRFVAGHSHGIAGQRPGRAGDAADAVSRRNGMGESEGFRVRCLNLSAPRS